MRFELFEKVAGPQSDVRAQLTRVSVIRIKQYFIVGQSKSYAFGHLPGDRLQGNEESDLNQGATSE